APPLRHSTPLVPVSGRLTSKLPALPWVFRETAPWTVGAPGVTSRNAALIGPQVWKVWKLFTPRPRTKIMWRPTDKLVVSMVALTGTVGELNVPFVGMAVPPAQGGVSM